MKMPSVSVVVPVYNAVNYLPRCLDSVLAQTMGDFELLCIDDGSSDGSTLILENYAKQDKRIKLFFQKNKGVSAARNIGIEKACSSYVCFVDADDYVHPKMLEMLLKTAQNYDADVVASLIEKVYPDSKMKPDVLTYEKLNVEIIDNPINSFIKDNKLSSSSNARLYKKNMLENIRFVEGIRYEDVPFSVEVMVKASKLVLIKNALYYYFQHNESFMHKPFLMKNVEDYATVMRLVYQIGKTKCPAKLSDLKRNVINVRFKMMVNQAVRRQKDANVQKLLFKSMQGYVKNLYHDGILSYSGLKLKHKIRLWLLLNSKSAEPCRYWANLI